MSSLIPTPDQQAALTVACNILSPLYMLDPAEDSAWNLIQSIAQTDADAITCEWTWGDPHTVRKAFQLLIAGAHENQDALSWEYRRLFVGPQKKAAPPWGSVYMDHEGVIFGDTTMDLRQWMREHGVVKTAEETMPEDHMGYQLMLLAYLAQEKPELVAEYAQLHLLTWSEHFFTILGEATTLDFYHGLAMLSQATLQDLQETLQIEVIIPRFYR